MLWVDGKTIIPDEGESYGEIIIVFDYYFYLFLFSCLFCLNECKEIPETKEYKGNKDR